mmetsp:Transcript_9735/g.36115  ORF Transcript_9735/g.36115 Transcript_9735/m.36115 type:complete len:248 (-) Transcript_9735:2274-3017(-)
MVCVLFGVKFTPNPPPIGGSGVGAIHACADNPKEARPPSKFFFELSRKLASPCFRPFSFSIIKSVSGPGVNPSPSLAGASPAVAVGGAFAGVTVPSLLYGDTDAFPLPALCVEGVRRGMSLNALNPVIVTVELATGTPVCSLPHVFVVSPAPSGGFNTNPSSVLVVSPPNFPTGSLTLTGYPSEPPPPPPYVSSFILESNLMVSVPGSLNPERDEDFALGLVCAVFTTSASAKVCAPPKDPESDRRS